MMHCPKCGKEAAGDAVFCSACGAKLTPSQTKAATPPGIFKFACPHCSQRIAVKIEWSGRFAKCPGCGSTIQIPTPEGVDAPPHPHPAEAVPSETPQPTRNERKVVIPPPPVRKEPPPSISTGAMRNPSDKESNVRPAVKLAPRPVVPVPTNEAAAAPVAPVSPTLPEGGNSAENNPVPPPTESRRPVLTKVPPPPPAPSQPRPVVISAPYEPGKIRPVLRPVNCSGSADEEKEPESFRPVLRPPKK